MADPAAQARNCPLGGLALSLLIGISIGFRSGEYLGRYRSVARRAYRLHIPIGAAGNGRIKWIGLIAEPTGMIFGHDQRHASVDFGYPVRWRLAMPRSKFGILWNALVRE